MPTALPFTKAAIADLPHPEKGKVRYRDARTQGLYLVVSPNSKTFVVLKRHLGRLHEIAIGQFPATSIENARLKTLEIIAALQAGTNIDTAKFKPRGRSHTFGELFAWWLEAHAKPHRATWQQDAANYERYLARPLGNKQLNLISRHACRELHLELGRTKGERTANVAISLIRVAWNGALNDEFTDIPNPAAAVRQFKLQARARRLSPEEAHRLLAELVNCEDHLRHLVLLLLFTGARLGNVLSMRWDQIDWQRAEWTIPRTKNGRAQTLPLEEAELAILRERLEGRTREYVFPARRSDSKTPHLVEPKKAWASLLKRAGIEDLHIHDLRRSLGSFMVDSGASLPIIGQALGHTSPAATAIYARLQLNPVREAKRRAIGTMTGQGS